MFKIKKVIKASIKYVLPKSILKLILNYKIIYTETIFIKKSYLYDRKRFEKQSSSLYTNSEQKLIGKIIREYHVVEKGLTMTEPRFGFGKDLIIALSIDCLEYIEKYGTDEEQLQHAIGVIFEYKLFHEAQKFNLDQEVLQSIEMLKQKCSHISPSVQRNMTKNDFFKHSESSFPIFAQSRASVRNYTNEKIPIEKISKALEIAQSTPSQCNRQCWRTYVYTDKKTMNEILIAQGGNRGFGHRADKLIVITAEIGVFGFHGERNSAYIDGGMYAMNLLYSLHYERISACILNCNTWPEKDLELRKLCGIKESEVFIAMITCGIPPENFRIASSKRYYFDKLVRYL